MEELEKIARLLDIAALILQYFADALRVIEGLM